MQIKMKTQNIKSLEEIRHEVGEHTFRGWEALTESGYFNLCMKHKTTERLPEYQARIIREFYNEFKIGEQRR